MSSFLKWRWFVLMAHTVVERITCNMSICHILTAHRGAREKKRGILDFLKKNGKILLTLSGESKSSHHHVHNSTRFGIMTCHQGSSQSWWPHPFVQIDHCDRCGGCTIHDCSASRSKWPTTPGCTKRYQEMGCKIAQESECHASLVGLVELKQLNKSTNTINRSRNPSKYHQGRKGRLQVLGLDSSNLWFMMKPYIHFNPYIFWRHLSTCVGLILTNRHLLHIQTTTPQVSRDQHTAATGAEPP